MTSWALIVAATVPVYAAVMPRRPLLRVGMSVMAGFWAIGSGVAMSSFIASQDLAFLATSFLAALQVPVFGWVAYKDRLKPADRARRLLGVVMMFGAIFAFYLSRLAYPDAVLDPAFRIPCVIVLMTLGFLTTLRRGGNEWLLALPASWAIIHAAIIVPERPISAMVLITYALLAYVATNVHRWRVVWSHNHQH